MGTKPDISVIIPTYNYAHFIELTIESVLSQNVDNVEVIIIDDGSTDRTREVVAPFLSAGLKYYYQENAGLSSARNKGIRECSGQYIQFLDADDLLGPNALGCRLAFLQQNPQHSMAVSRSRLFRGMNGYEPNPLFLSGWPLYSSHLDVHLCYSNLAPPHAYLFRRKVIEETGWFDPGMKACEDYDYWLRALAFGYKPVYCPQGLVYYRRHRTSMSAQLDRQYEHDRLICLRLAQILEEDNALRHHPFRLEMIWAFMAGSLRTLLFLYPRLGQLDAQLLEVVRKSLQLTDKPLKAKSTWNVLLQFYYVKILSLVHSFPGDGRGALGEIREDLELYASRLGAPSGMVPMVKESLRLALFAGEANCLERWRLLKSTTNNLFR